MYNERYARAGEPHLRGRERWRGSFISRKRTRGGKTREIDRKSNTSTITSTLLARAEDLLRTSLAPKTREGYSSIIQQYREYMFIQGEDELNPSQEVVLKWVAYESLFLDSGSLAKYVQAVAYYLDGYGTKTKIKNVLTNRMLRLVRKRYGVRKRDDRAPVTIDLLFKIMKKIDMEDPVDLCCMAASVIAFLNCLRCGEFTINQQGDRFLKRKDWSHEGDYGKIFLEYSKTDINGTGHWIKYRRMKSDLDPIFWMNKYADSVKNWKGKESDPLFILPSGEPLDKKTLIVWLRRMAQAVGDPNAEKLNGISFRRGGAQALRNQGYKLDELGRIGRWISQESAARYVELTPEVVDEFADAFDRAAHKDR